MFKKLFENSPNNNKLVSFFKFLLFDTESSTLTEKNPYKDIEDTQYTYYIIDKEDTVIKMQTFKDNLKRFSNDLEKKLKEEYYKNKKIKKNKINQAISCIKAIKRKYQQLPYLFNFSFSYTLLMKISNDLSTLIPVKVNSLEIEGDLKIKEYQEVHSIIEPLKSGKIVSKVKLIEEFEIDLNQFQIIKCSNPQCNKEINNNEGVYYCYWCNIFYCEKCVENKFLTSSPRKMDKLIHKDHNLLYFVTREEKDLSHLDKVRLGNNLFSVANDEDLRCSNDAATCHGCQEEIDFVPRYICISCKPGIVRDKEFNDYCYKCIEHLRKNDEKGKLIESMVDNLSYPGEQTGNLNYIIKQHSHKHHVYLCLILQINDEYNNY